MPVNEFVDGLYNIFNSFANTRNVLNHNVFTHDRVDASELNNIYKSGIGNKIVRLKTGAALNDTIQFESEADRLIYEAKVDSAIREVTTWMLAFGRGIILLHDSGEKDLSQPRKKVYDPNTVQFKVFSGDMVSVQSMTRDLLSPRYNKPELYSVNGYQFHHTRVVDFAYIKPTEKDLPTYQYGGISEFELIRNQLINDAIVEKASPSILEKNSTLYYKLKDFKQAMDDERDTAMKEYYAELENYRSIYGAALIDSEDDVTAIEQKLSNLADADTITLRRLAMVTGIPLALLVGENVKGLNSSGENEMRIYQDMIEALEENYLKAPLNEIMSMLGMGRISFKDNQGRTPDDRMNFDTKAIDNALKLASIGEDYEKYLESHGVTLEDSYDKFFKDK